MNQTAKETKSEATLNTSPITSPESDSASSDALNKASEIHQDTTPSPQSKASRHRLFLILIPSTHRHLVGAGLSAL